jgi:O-antigen/teichoic acid export membrane protein
MYIGLVVGFANNVLFPRYVGEDVLGFTHWLFELASLFILVASFGSNATIIRYFPYFKDKAAQHGGYLSFLFWVRSIGLVLATLIIILAKDWILQIYDNEQGRLYVEQYYYLLIASLALIAYMELLENYLAALLRPRVPTFFRDVLARLLALGLIGLYAFGQIGLEVFIIGYTCRFIVSVVGMLGFTWHIGELHLRSGWPLFRQPIFKEMAGYSFYSAFASFGSKITTKIDILMIPALLSFSAGGIYTVFTFFASVIIVPHNGLAKIASPMLADAWKREDFEEINGLYGRLALNNLAAGLLVYVGILINLDHIVSIIGPQFEVGKYVAVFLGLGQLAHVANGYSGLLLNYSPLYRYDLLFKIVTALLTVITNYIFITWMGITGAAIATALTIIVINGATQIFLYRNYRMHPFSWGMARLGLAALAAFGLNFLLPELNAHFLFDLVYRSGIVTLAYGAMIVGLRLAPDVADFFWEQWGRFRRG